MRRIPTPIAVIVATLALACAPRSDAPRDIVLITIDTLRADHLGTYGYPRGTSPHIDRWFTDALIVERSYSTSASTPPSMVSLLSGVVPTVHQVRQYYQLVPEDVPFVSEMLPLEYETAAFVSNIVLTNEALGIAGRFDHFDDFVDEKEPNRLIYERTARRTTNAALAWLATERDQTRPLFLWVHYIDPHGPYIPPPDWPRRFEHEGHRPVGPGDVPGYVLDATVTDAWDYVDRYDDEIRYVDHDVGRLMRILDLELGLDDALVVLSADHGESLDDHELWFRHGHGVYEEVIRVPFLMRGPGAERRIERGPSLGTDVVPTLLAFAGADPPVALSGHSWWNGRGAPSDRVIEVEATGNRGHWRAVLWPGHKLMRLFERPAGRVAATRYFDLERDPLEQSPGAEAPHASGLPRGIVDAWSEDPYLVGPPPGIAMGRKLTDPKISPRADDEALEALRALGYVD